MVNRATVSTKQFLPIGANCIKTYIYYCMGIQHAKGGYKVLYMGGIGTISVKQRGRDITEQNEEAGPPAKFEI